MIHHLPHDPSAKRAPCSRGDLSLQIETMRAVLDGIDADKEEAVQDQIYIVGGNGGDGTTYFRMSHEGLLWFIQRIESIFSGRAAPVMGRLGPGEGRVAPSEEGYHCHLSEYLPDELTVGTGADRFTMPGGDWLAAAPRVWLAACQEWRAAMTRGVPFSIILDKSDTQWCSPEATGQFRIDYLPDLHRPEWPETRDDERLPELSQPLQQAVLKNDLDQLRQLLSRRDTPIDQDDSLHGTALHVAIRFGRVEAARLLVEHGAKLNFIDCLSQTPLDLATQKGSRELVLLLLEHGAICDRGTHGMSPLHWATWGRHQDLVRIFLDRGANVNRIASHGTALHCAVRMGDDGLARLLVTRGADVGIEDGGGWTALHWAAFWGQLGTMELLLQHGADVNARTHRGSTPARCAVQLRQKDAIRLLAAHGADLAQANALGETPLSVAAELGYDDIVALLEI